jgi:hypothetical protein
MARMKTPVDLPLACVSAEGAFPGHFWLLEAKKDLNNLNVTHHECRRCGAMKDVPTVYGSATNWKSDPSKAKKKEES